MAVVLALASLAGLGGFVDLVATRRILRREQRGNLAELRRLEAELAEAAAERQSAPTHARNGRKRRR